MHVLLRTNMIYACITKNKCDLRTMTPVAKRNTHKTDFF